MAQIAVDAKGNKIRWDESRGEWVPVEKAVNERGVEIEFDGAKWNAAKKERKPLEIPKRPGVLSAIGQGLKKTGQQVVSPVEGAVRMAAGVPAWMAGTATTIGAQPFVGWEKAGELGGKVSGALSGGESRLGGESTANVEQMLSPLAAPFALALEKGPESLAPGEPGTQAMLGAGLSAVMILAPKLGITPKTALREAKLKIWRDKTIPAKERAAAISDMNKAEMAGAKTIGEVVEPKPAVPAEPTPPVSKIKTAVPEAPKPTPLEAVAPAGTPPAAPPSPKITSPESQLTEALKQSKAIQPQQKALYKQERGKRVGEIEEMSPNLSGQQRFYAKKGILKGELPKVDFEPLTLNQAAKDALHDQIHYSKSLRELEKVGTGEALERMFNGKFPSPHEVKMMNKVFGGELMDTLMKQMSTKDKFWYWGGQIANIPRTLMASFDLSAPFRQGIFMIGRPKKFFGSFGSMFKSFAKEANYSKVMSEIASRPTYELMRESGLDITAVKSSLKVSEEPFMGGDIIARGGAWAKKNLPSPVGGILDIIPKGVEASQRAYTAFLNKLRADVFDSLTKQASEMGLYNVTEQGGKVVKNLNSNPKLSQDIAWYINAATGRGRLPDLAMKSADVLNAVFFSPRLMSSRLTLLNPATYFNPARSSFVRTEALGDFARFFGLYTTVSMLAMLKGREHLGLDPRSADYGKIKLGNTRIDFGGGFGQYVRTALQASMPVFKALGLVDEAELVSSKTGKKTKIGGGFNETSVREILTRFITQKQSPIASLIWDALGQRSSEGGPIEIGKELRERITPMIVEDIIAASKDDPNQFKAVLVGLLVMFGAGAQTYGPDAEKTFLDQSGQPYRGGDRVIDELNRLGVKAGIGAKEIKGKPIDEPDIGRILEQGEAEIRKRILFYMDNKTYKNATDEQKKAWLQKAVEAGRKAAKDKYRFGVK